MCTINLAIGKVASFNFCCTNACLQLTGPSSFVHQKILCLLYLVVMGSNAVQGSSFSVPLQLLFDYMYTLADSVVRSCRFSL